MDKNPQDFVIKKKELELAFASRLVEEIKVGGITYDQLREISRYILLEMEKLKTTDDLANFTTILSQKWTFFEKVQKVEEVKKTEQGSTSKMNAVREQLLKLSGNKS